MPSEQSMFLRVRLAQIIAIDYTKSNSWTGRKSYGGKNLHFLDPENLEANPYMQARIRRPR